jgi:hypothetical protein
MLDKSNREAIKSNRLKQAEACSNLNTPSSAAVTGSELTDPPLWHVQGVDPLREETFHLVGSSVKTQLDLFGENCVKLTSRS